MKVLVMNADPPPLRWKDEPDRPGWYWYRRLSQHSLIQGPIAVFKAYGQLCFTPRGFDAGPRPCKYKRRQWAGPIQRPEDG